MRVWIRRTSPDRNPDVYIMRFPPFDVPDRWIAFRAEEFEKLCDVRIDRGAEVEMEMEIARQR